MSAGEAFRRTELLMGAAAFDAVSRMRVAVFGVGGVGSWCAEALVRTGVGGVMLVDDDRVAASNVNRQLPATSRTVGRLKVEAMRERLLEINPAAEIEARAERYAPESAERFRLVGFDVVVDAIDSVACKAALIRHALSVEGLLLVSSMGAAGRTDPARIRVTPFEEVVGDGLARALRHRFRRDGAGLPRSFTCVWSDEPCVNHGERRPEDGAANGSFAPVTAAFGLHLAAVALRRRQIFPPPP